MHPNASATRENGAETEKKVNFQSSAVFFYVCNLRVGPGAWRGIEAGPRDVEGLGTEDGGGLEVTSPKHLEVTSPGWSLLEAADAGGPKTLRRCP